MLAPAPQPQFTTHVLEGNPQAHRFRGAHAVLHDGVLACSTSMNWAVAAGHAGDPPAPDIGDDDGDRQPAAFSKAVRPWPAAASFVGARSTSPAGQFRRGRAGGDGDVLVGAAPLRPGSRGLPGAGGQQPDGLLIGFGDGPPQVNSTVRRRVHSDSRCLISSWLAGPSTRASSPSASGREPGAAPRSAPEVMAKVSTGVAWPQQHPRHSAHSNTTPPMDGSRSPS